MIGSNRLKTIGALVSVAMLAVACGGTGTGSEAPASDAPASDAPSSGAPASQAAGGEYRIGYSNGGGVGNVCREEQVCTA